MSAAAPNVPSFVGRRFGRYLLRHAIGHGGMATVYLAQLAGVHRFERWVAVKVIHPHLALDREFVSMFLDEANLAARIQHPNVSAVLDFGEQDGVPYLVMEYMHGETLGAAFRRVSERGEGVPLWLACRVLADVARGLHAAHDLRGNNGKLLGLVHRDVTPQNVMILYAGLTKIMDFGVAQAEGRLTHTRAGEVKGKFGYMSPEQLRGKDLDRRADVWSLGVLLWEATVGRRLFRAPGEGETAVLVLQAPITRPREIVADYPAIVDAVVMSALQREAKQRTATASVFADALEQYLASLGRPVGTQQVCEWMSTRFADRREKRNNLLSAAKSGLVELPEVDLESQRSAPGAASDVRTPPARTGHSGVRAPATDERRSPRRRSSALRWAVFIVGGTFAVIAASFVPALRARIGWLDAIHRSLSRELAPVNVTEQPTDVDALLDAEASPQPSTEQSAAAELDASFALDAGIATRTTSRSHSRPRTNIHPRPQSPDDFPAPASGGAVDASSGAGTATTPSGGTATTSADHERQTAPSGGVDAGRSPRSAQ